MYADDFEPIDPEDDELESSEENRGRKPSNTPSESKFLAAVRQYKKARKEDALAELTSPAWLTVIPEEFKTIDNRPMRKAAIFRTGRFFEVADGGAEVNEVILSLKDKKHAEVTREVLNTYQIE